MRNIEIEVTKDDIDNGERGNAEFCPIACAAKRLFPNSYVRVDDVLEIENIETLKTDYYELSESALEFIYNFDVGRYVKPFNFVALSDD